MEVEGLFPAVRQAYKLAVLVYAGVVTAHLVLGVEGQPQEFALALLEVH